MLQLTLKLHYFKYNKLSSKIVKFAFKFSRCKHAKQYNADSQFQFGTLSDQNLAAIIIARQDQI